MKRRKGGVIRNKRSNNGRKPVANEGTKGAYNFDTITINTTERPERED